MNYKKIILTTILVLIIVPIVAQNNHKGFNFTLETGGYIGNKKLKMLGLSALTAVAGHSFNEHLFVGGGATINYYKIGDVGTLSLPLFARVKYSVLKSKITPYISSDIGCDPLYGGINYDINSNYIPKDGDIWPSVFKGGFYVHPQIGIMYRLQKRKSINLSIGYLKQRGRFYIYEKNKQGGLDYNEYKAARAISVKIGYTF